MKWVYGLVCNEMALQNVDIRFCLHETDLYKVDLWVSPHEVYLEFGHHEVNVKLMLQVPYPNVLKK